MRTIAVLNCKGGVGKTTTAINLAYLLATEHNQRVLLVDADAQCNSTWTLLPEGDYDGLPALLTGTATVWDEVVIHTDLRNLDMIPASNELWSLDLTYITCDGSVSFNALRDAVECMAEDDAYDVVLIDCPPNFSTACMAAIMAADSIVIPAMCDAYGAKGVADIVEQINDLRKIHPTLRVAGVLLTNYTNSPAQADMAEYFRENAPAYVFQTMIRHSEKVPESISAAQSVLLWSPRSGASKDYRAWVRELCDREGIK